MMGYDVFIASKSAVAPHVGFVPDQSAFPKELKLFQRDIVTWACRRGRAAVFAGTGLGRTVQQLAWASQVARHTGGRVILFAPLAVAFQTVQEAEKFGIQSVSYASDENEIHSDIVVTNYERRHLFDLDQSFIAP